MAYSPSNKVYKVPTYLLCGKKYAYIKSKQALSAVLPGDIGPNKDHTSPNDGKKGLQSDVVLQALEGDALHATNVGTCTMYISTFEEEIIRQLF